jgi:hypothetical protein
MRSGNLACEGLWLARRRAWCQLSSSPVLLARTFAHPPSAITLPLTHTPRSLHCHLHIYLLSLPTTIATPSTAIPYRRPPSHLDRHSFRQRHLHIPAGKGATTASETPDTTSIPPRRLGSHDICFGHQRPRDPSAQGGTRCHCDLDVFS